MDTDFWWGALRDFSLLVAGGALTILGGWLSNRQANRRSEEARRYALADAKEAHSVAALESARSAIFVLYVAARTESEKGRSGWIELEEADLLTAESCAYLIPDHELRELVRKALEALRVVGLGVDEGRIKGNAYQHQVQLLYGILRLVSARLRGDPLNAPTVGDVQRISDESREAWMEITRSRGASASP